MKTHHADWSGLKEDFRITNVKSGILQRQNQQNLRNQKLTVISVWISYKVSFNEVNKIKTYARLNAKLIVLLESLSYESLCSRQSQLLRRTLCHPAFSAHALFSWFAMYMLLLFNCVPQECMISSSSRWPSGAILLLWQKTHLCFQHWQHIRTATTRLARNLNPAGFFVFFSFPFFCSDGQSFLLAPRSP